MSEPSPDHYDQPSFGFEYPVHFASGLMAVGKVLEAELREDDVERRYAKRERSCIAFAPLHRTTIRRRR
jgi:hypothetical protein